MGQIKNVTIPTMDLADSTGGGHRYFASTAASVIDAQITYRWGAGVPPASDFAQSIAKFEARVRLKHEPKHGPLDRSMLHGELESQLRSSTVQALITICQMRAELLRWGRPLTCAVAFHRAYS